MHIACLKNHGIPYLQVMESYSIKVDGIHKSRKRVIRNLGPLSRFDDGKPDFLSRLRKSFKDGKPIIDGLDDLLDQMAVSKKVSVEFDRSDDTAAFSNPQNIGYFILDSLYDKLGIYDVLTLHKSRSKIEYDLNGLAKLLVFSRIQNPDSKYRTWENKNNYLFDITSSKELVEIYRALDVLCEKSDAIQKRMNLKISQSIGRDTDVCFYDVTNYWFETDGNDEDIKDAAGNVTKEGLRKSGPSKAKNRKPIVQMGLFIDSNGIPISFRLFPGNHIDQTTLRPAMKKTIDQMKFGKVIIVADGGLNSGKNLAHILSSGNGYIVSKSAKGSPKAVRTWILEEEGYRWNKEKTFKSKSMIRERIVKDEQGNSVTIKEKIVSFWSKKQRNYAMHENKKFIDYLSEVIENPDKLKDKQSNIKKFLEKTQVDKETGEILENAVSVLSLDMDKISEYINIMGYYTVMTSELDMPDGEVIDKYHGLSRIEDSFKIIKSDLEGRPVYVWNPEHIQAHFLVCFIALTMIRLIQHNVLVSQGKETKNARGWEAGITSEKIKHALSSWCADAFPGGFYRLTRPTEELRLILDSVDISPDIRIPTISEIRKLKYCIGRADFM